MREAFKKMYLVSKVYLNRTETLYYDLTFDSCDEEYYHTFDSSGSPFITILEQATELTSTFPKSTSQSQIDAIYSAAFEEPTGLEHYNTNIQLHSCPEIY